MNTMCSDLDDIKNLFKNLSLENKQMQLKLNQLEEKLSQQEFKVNYMESQFDRTIQNENARNIVICGLPAEAPDVPKLVVETINKVDNCVKDCDIVSIKRMYHSSNSKSTLKNSYIVSFTSAQLKNDVLSKYFKVKSSSLSNIIDGLNFMQHFSKFQSKLYKEAKSLKTKYKFQFLWHKDGKILLRKNPDSEIHHILSMNDIFRLQCGLSSKE